MITLLFLDTHEMRQTVSAAGRILPDDDCCWRLTGLCCCMCSRTARWLIAIWGVCMALAVVFAIVTKVKSLIKAQP